MKVLKILLTLVSLSAVAAIPAHAANRVLFISAPPEVAPGGTVTVSISASTDAGDGEEIGFLHAEYSIDAGKTWSPIIYAQKVGPMTDKQIVFVAGANGVKTLIRARAAFRGGKAGDVDRLGNAIDWNGSWENWRAPCTKFAIIYVTGR
jgi:hypothetical protein